jgi:hypothetical protein
LTPERIEEFKLTLLSLFTRLSDVAQSASDKLSLSFKLSLLSGCWLTYFVYSLLDLSPMALLPFFLGFSLPAFFIWRLQGTLQNVVALPEQLNSAGDSIKHVLSELKGNVAEHFNALKAQRTGRIKIKELYEIGTQLLGMRKFLTELRTQLGDAGRPEAIEAVIVVASPGFVILMSIATIGSTLLLFLAVVSGIAYLFIT